MFIYTVFSVITIVLLLETVGDIGGAEKSLSIFVVTRKGQFLSSLPSGFTWFYVYVTAGLANLAYNFIA